MVTGQLISREIMDIDEQSCPREIHPVDVSDDEIFIKNKSKEEMINMPVYRSKYDKQTGIYSGNPRKQVTNGAVLQQVLAGINDITMDSVSREVGLFE